MGSRTEPVPCVLCQAVPEVLEWKWLAPAKWRIECHDPRTGSKSTHYLRVSGEDRRTAVRRWNRLMSGPSKDIHPGIG